MPTPVAARRRRAGDHSHQLALRLNPVIAFYEVPLAEAQRLLIAWRHPLHLPTPRHPNGQPYNRPFGRMSFVMEDNGRPAAVVVLASTINVNVNKEHGFSELPKKYPQAGASERTKLSCFHPGRDVLACKGCGMLGMRTAGCAMKGPFLTLGVRKASFVTQPTPRGAVHDANQELATRMKRAHC